MALLRWHWKDRIHNEQSCVFKAPAAPVLPLQLLQDIGRKTGRGCETNKDWPELMWVACCPLDLSLLHRLASAPPSFLLRWTQPEAERLSCDGKWLLTHNIYSFIPPVACAWSLRGCKGINWQIIKLAFEAYLFALGYCGFLRWKPVWAMTINHRVTHSLTAQPRWLTGGRDDSRVWMHVGVKEHQETP